MISLCKTQGHSYVYTSAGKSSRCLECQELRMPWHTESEASMKAGAALLALLESRN